MAKAFVKDVYAFSEESVEIRSMYVDFSGDNIIGLKDNVVRMDKVYDICSGIDVHKKLIVACLRKGNKHEVREFGATTRELLELADWLKESGCEMSAMESTASYWKPLYNILLY